MNQTISKQLLDSLKDSLRLIEMLMPGVRHLAIQDYAFLNDAPMRARQAITAAEQAEPMAPAIKESLTADRQAEPVAAQCRFEGEEEWSPCTLAHHLLVQAHPKEWPHYETRALYAQPSAQQQAEPVNQQLLSLAKSFGHKVGCAKNAFGEQCTCGVDETIAAAEQAQQADNQSEEAAYIKWMCETFPTVYDPPLARLWIEQKHVSFLAWMERAMQTVQQQAEPVAWVMFDRHGTRTGWTSEKEYTRHAFRSVPLYAQPPAVPDNCVPIPAEWIQGLLLGDRQHHIELRAMLAAAQKGGA